MTRLRKKVLFTLSVLGLLFVIMAASGFWAISRMGDLNSLSGKIDGILFQTVSMVKTQEEFLNQVTLDTSFYRTGKSELVDQHNALLENINADLNLLLDDELLQWVITREDSGKHLRDQLNGDLEAYNLEVSKLFALFLSRGFRDYGIVGEMRKNAHLLENAPEGVPTQDILMLRRHEKDYIIRKDSQYVRRFLNLAGRVKIDLETRPHHFSARHMQALGEYVSLFQQMVELERKIGLTQEPGSQQTVRSLSDHLINLTLEIAGKVNHQAASLRTLVRSMFIGFAILSLGICFLLGYSLTREIAGK
ncbi:MAG: hypothetical protein H6581_11115 [Bacteroidia bacterium]|nr:hypothetical protein [Bacteroidia bacterium]